MKYRTIHILLLLYVMGTVFAWGHPPKNGGGKNKKGEKRAFSAVAITTEDDGEAAWRESVPKRLELKKELKRMNQALSREWTSKDARNLCNLRIAKGQLKDHPMSARAGYTGNEKKSTPRSYAGERQIQMNRTLSTQLFFAAKEAAGTTKKFANPVEVQVMTVDNKIFISTNTANDITLVKKALTKEGERAFTKDYSYLTKKEPEKKVLERFQQRLSQMFSNSYDYSSRAGMEEIQNTIVNLKDALASSGRELREMNLDEKTEDPFAEGHDGPEIILVRGRDDIHAERKLSLIAKHIADNSHHAREFQIAGKKRPCLSCLVDLLYRCKNEGVDISYLKNPGKVWLGQLASVINEHKKEDIFDHLSEEWWDTYITDELGPGWGSESSEASGFEEDKGQNSEEQDSEEEERAGKRRKKMINE